MLYIPFPEMKLCGTCGECKHISFYCVTKKGLYKRHSICKECQNVASSIRRAANLEIHRSRDREYARNRRAAMTDEERKHKNVYDRQYYRDNKERFAEYAKEYRETHSTEIKEINRKYQISHLEYYRKLQGRPDQKRRRSEYGKQWRRENKSKCREYFARHKALKNQADGSFTGNDILAQHKRQKGRCYYCKEEMGSKYHIEHVVPLSRGGSNNLDNIVLACPHCNLSKRDKLPCEWPEGGRLL